MNLLSAKIQDNQLNTLTQCENFYTSKLSPNNNTCHQESDIQTKSELSKTRTKSIFRIVSPSTNTKSVSSKNNTISNEATTILTVYSIFLSKDYLDTSLQEMLAKSDQIFEKQKEELKQLR